MLDATIARKKVYSSSKAVQFEDSLEAAIIYAISNKQLHAEWYTPALYNCNQDDVDSVNNLAYQLRIKGYKVTVTVMEPNERFTTRRCKLHINWE